MGKRADELGLTLDADTDAMTLTGRGLGESATEAQSAYAALTEIPERLGLGGLSGDAATSRILDIARKIDAVGSNLRQLGAAAKAAQGAVKGAQSDFHALPDGALTFAERAAITAGGTILMPGIGTVAADKAGSIWSNQREQARERAADKALSRLASVVDGISIPRVSALDGFSSDSIDTTEETGRQPDVSRSADPRGYSPTVGGTGSGARSVGTVGTGTPGVGTSWQPPVSSGIDTGLGGGSTGGSGGSGSGNAGGGGIGGGGTGGGAGSGAGNGSGIGGDVVPGSGDGSSSDGIVGGTVPGGTGAGGGFLGGPGGSGSGASGAGSLGGVGAGGLAGGLTVGGAALGAAGLNRLAGGSAGAGGLGGAGGFGGGSFGGGTFAAGGGYGAGGAGAGGAQLGTSGSALSGSTSGLGQGSQAGAAGAGASGARSAGGMMGGPMGGGGAGASKDAKRRASGGLLAPDIEVEDGAQRHDLGAGAGAGGRDTLRTPAPTVTEPTDDEW